MSRLVGVALVVLSTACAADSPDIASAPAGKAEATQASAIARVNLPTPGDARPAFIRSPLPEVREVTSFRWIVPVSNDSDEDGPVQVTLRFLDRYGNEVQRLERAITVVPGSRRDFSGEWLSLASESFRITKLEVTSTTRSGRVLFSGAATEVYERN